MKKCRSRNSAPYPRAPALGRSGRSALEGVFGRSIGGSPKSICGVGVANGGLFATRVVKGSLFHHTMW